MEFYKIIKQQMATKQQTIHAYDNNTNKTIVLQIKATTINDAKKIAKLQNANITFID